MAIGERSSGFVVSWRRWLPLARRGSPAMRPGGPLPGRLSVTGRPSYRGRWPRRDLQCARRRSGASARSLRRQIRSLINAGKGCRMIETQPTIRLGDLAHARSGDKGNTSNIGVVARDDASFEALSRVLTED